MGVDLGKSGYVASGVCKTRTNLVGLPHSFLKGLLLSTCWSPEAMNANPIPEVVPGSKKRHSPSPAFVSKAMRVWASSYRTGINRVLGGRF